MITNKVLSKLLDSFKINCAVFPISITGTPQQQRYRNRYHRHNIPKLRFPYWYIKQNRDQYDEKLTEENKNFINEIVHNTYGPPGVVGGVQTFLHTPLKQEPVLRGTWFPECMRTGLIAVKLGTLPQWLKNGQMIYTTLLQVIDNHVIKFIPPGKNDLRHYGKRLKKRKDLGSLVVGAINCDPQQFTESYCQLFSKAGVMPKKVLTKFFIHPEANIQPGTPLLAAHFRVGDMVDITGKTKYQGFQGVMKRWGFHGMPASHGQTKTHRRPGNIGGGGEKARVWPGKKMPGHVGHKIRTQSGLMIMRINHKYNVIYTRGPGIPGGTNDIVYIHDTLIKAKRPTVPPHFPTYYPQDHQEELPEEEFHESLFRFSDPSIEFEEIRAAANK